MNNRKQSWILNGIAASVLLTGLLTIGNTLFALVHPRHVRIAILDAHFTVLAGISLVYLATLLRRGKQNAWLISLLVYGFLIVRNFQHFVVDLKDPERHLSVVLLSLGLPVATFLAISFSRKLFNVRSELRSFGVALRRSTLILVVAFLYGVIGFQLFDEHDFHQEIPPLTAVHYTVDQFGLTTNNQPVGYTKRARFFADSLAAVSLASVFYVGVAFFAPIRFRLRHNQQDYQDMLDLTRKYATTSEDFFKFWPRDKDYFFDSKRKSALAYRVSRGVALVVGDPVGRKESLTGLLNQFGDYCQLNDWQPAFIHTEPKNLSIYKKLGFEVQKIGEEAVIDTKNFCLAVAPGKYFRQINNRFEKLHYSCEMLDPPHDRQVINRLRQVSDDWLQVPGREERGLMMGYFSEGYLQQCSLMVARDHNGQIQAFLNQVTSPISSEANYDFLRATKGAQGNINDYLMLNFIKKLYDRGVPKLNMGLSPLAGLSDTETGDRSMVDSLLNFVYTNAGWFYSFQGLTKFKSKYEPDWQPRYIVYSGGVRGLTKTTNALLRAMNR